MKCWLHTACQNIQHFVDFTKNKLVLPLSLLTQKMIEAQYGT